MEKTVEKGSKSEKSDVQGKDAVKIEEFSMNVGERPQGSYRPRGMFRGRQRYARGRGSYKFGAANMEEQNFKWRKTEGSWNARGRGGFSYPARERPQKFPGRKEINPEVKQKYSRGEGVDVSHVRQNRHKVMKMKLKKRDLKLKEAEEETARAEVLLTESSGLLETEDGTYTSHVTQKDIRDAVDITSAAKSFELSLKEFGPYKMQFTRNGRHLLLGGMKGHLASFDWITKKLHFEINVMEEIHDVCWLHTEQMMAAAQKSYVYIYDHQGTEIHCLKGFDRINKLEFLPYHFLLCGGGDTGYLSWVDISLGKEYLTVPTKKGRIDVMRQNPYNAVICCGHSRGTVTMWTPNEKEPVASILCHANPVTAIEFDPAGRNFATAGVNGEIKIWDARNLGDSLQRYRVRSGITSLSFSQKQLLAVSMGNIVEVYDKVITGEMRKPYMNYRCKGFVSGMQFCPYEDVLGVSTFLGYASLLIPGAGEPNFDALESNPYMTVSGRREAEIKSLLGKVPYELITLDPRSISQVDVPRLEEKLEAKRALKYIKVPDIDVQPRYRMKGKSGSAQKFKRKNITQDIQKRSFLKNAITTRDELGLSEKKRSANKKTGGLLDRFHTKTQS